MEHPSKRTRADDMQDIRQILDAVSRLTPDGAPAEDTGTVSVNVTYSGSPADGISGAQTEVRFFSGDGETCETMVPVTASPDNLEQIAQTVKRLMTPEEIRRADKILSRQPDEGNEAVALLKALLSAAASNGSIDSADALASLRKDEEAHQQFIALAAEETARRKQRARKAGRIVYLVAGIAIVIGLLWFLFKQGY